MPSVVEKTLRFDALKHEKGEVTLWGHSCLINPIIGVLVRDRLTQQLVKGDTRKKIDYFSEKFQAYMGVRITGEKFGYSQTFQKKKDLLLFSSGQSDLLGYGSSEWVRMDFANEHFVLHMNCTYAKVYKATLGLSKEPVDYWNAGAWAGVLDYILGKKTACIETSCIAKGQKYCEFVIRPLEKWDKKDPLVKANKFVFEDVVPQLGKVKL